MTLNDIGFDILKSIEEIQIKISKQETLIKQVQAQENVLPLIKTMTAGTDEHKFHLRLLGTAEFPGVRLDIDLDSLISIVQKNIEDNTALIHELAKELGIEVK